MPVARRRGVSTKVRWELPLAVDKSFDVAVFEPYIMGELNFIEMWKEEQTTRGLVGAAKYLQDNPSILASLLGAGGLAYHEAVGPITIPNEMVHAAEAMGLGVASLFDILDYGAGEGAYQLGKRVSTPFTPIFGEQAMEDLADSIGFGGFVAGNVVQTIFTGGGKAALASSRAARAGVKLMNWGPDVMVAVLGIPTAQDQAGFRSKGIERKGYSENLFSWTNLKKLQQMEGIGGIGANQRLAEGGFGRITKDDWIQEWGDIPIIFDKAFIGDRVPDHIIMEGGTVKEEQGSWEGDLVMVFTNGQKSIIGEFTHEGGIFDIAYDPRVIPNHVQEELYKFGLLAGGPPVVQKEYIPFTEVSYKKWYVEQNPYALPPARRNAFLKNRNKMLRPLRVTTQRTRYRPLAAPTTTRGLTRQRPVQRRTIPQTPPTARTVAPVRKRPSRRPPTQR